MAITFLALIGGGLAAQLVDFVINAIIQGGYLSVFVLMTLESMLIPIPSEVIMPFAGYLVFLNDLNFLLTSLVGAAGNLLGSVIAYYIGLRVGRNAVLKYGKYIYLNENHLKMAEGWFSRHGDKIIPLSRCLPIIRTYLSLPAGFAKMNFKKFAAYTFLGSLPWSFALTYFGLLLGNNWKTILGFTQYADIVVIVGVAALVTWFLLRRRKLTIRKKSQQPAATS